MADLYFTNLDRYVKYERPKSSGAIAVAVVQWVRHRTANKMHLLTWVQTPCALNLCFKV